MAMSTSIIGCRQRRRAKDERWEERGQRQALAAAAAAGVVFDEEQLQARRHDRNRDWVPTALRVYYDTWDTWPRAQVSTNKWISRWRALGHWAPSTMACCPVPSAFFPARLVVTTCRAFPSVSSPLAVAVGRGSWVPVSGLQKTRDPPCIRSSHQASPTPAQSSSLLRHAESAPSPSPPDRLVDPLPPSLRRGDLGTAAWSAHVDTELCG
jgi:hypothetical protein